MGLCNSDSDSHCYSWSDTNHDTIWYTQTTMVHTHSDSYSNSNTWSDTNHDTIWYT